MRRTTLWVILAPALLCVPSVAGAQMVSATTGAINGKVVERGRHGAGLVTVTIYSPAMMGLKTATTNAKGRYRFPALPPGTCKVACQRSGYSTRRGPFPPRSPQSGERMSAIGDCPGTTRW